MDQSGDALAMTCHNFSDIRRRPLVIGKLDQVRLPFVVTMPQLAVGAITFGLLFLTRPAWGAIMSDRLHIVTFVVTPIVVAQQVSRTSIEGRTVSKAAIGFGRLWLAPVRGEINGRRCRAATTTPLLLHPLTEQTGPQREPDRSPRNRGTARSPDRRTTATRERRQLAGLSATDTIELTPRARSRAAASTRPKVNTRTTTATSRRTRARRKRREGRS